MTSDLLHSDIARTVPFDEGWSFVLSKDDEEPAANSPWRSLNLPHDWSIEDLTDSQALSGTTNTSASSTLWADVEAPDVIGPFDRMRSEGKRNSGWTVGGIGWYRKDFDVPAETAGKHVTLRFDGIAVHSDVWLNGVHLGTHFNPYLPFSADLTPFLRNGSKNQILVRARNEGDTSRWYVGSGIYRHSWLTITEKTHIDENAVHVVTPEVHDEQSFIVSTVPVRNTGDSGAEVFVRCSVVAPSGKTLATAETASSHLAPGSEDHHSVGMSVHNVDLWSVERPSLYVLRSELFSSAGARIDEVETTFGIRSIEIDGAGLRLNGRTMKLRGANIHHDHGALGAVSLESAERRRILKLKDAGFNAIRCAHNPFGPAFYRACDELGMLVIDELSDVWDTPKTPQDSSSQFDAQWNWDVETMVMRDRNHPSIFMWSIGNEIRSDRAAEIQKDLANRIRDLDATRPITQGGASGYGFGIGLMPTTDPGWTTLDVADTHYLHDLGAATSLYPTRAFFSSESFVGSIYDDWQLVLHNDAMFGDFAWTAWDHIGEAGVGEPWLQPLGQPHPEENLENIGKQSLLSGEYPWYLSGCADIDILGERRPQWFYRSVVWGDSDLEVAVQRPTPEGQEQKAFSWSWFDELRSWTWDITPGQAMTVRAYTSGDEVTVSLNGVLLETRLVKQEDRCIATFAVPYHPGELIVTAKRQGREIATQRLESVGPATALRISIENAAAAENPDELLYSLIEVIDAAGRRVPDAVVNITVAVEGAGSLRALANANPRNVDSFTGNQRYTYLGVAQAIIQSDGSAGNVQITASASDLKSAAVTISAFQSSAR